MTTMDTINTRPPVIDVHETNVIAGRLNRISWGAILAGAVIAFVIQLGLNMLGLSIGVNTINPATEINPVEPGLGSAAVIWFAASGLIAFLIGGFVAGRMAGMADHLDGVVHGVLSWAIVGLVSLFLLTTSIGSVVSTATSAITQGIGLAGQAVSEISPEVADALNLQDISLQTILEEAHAALPQTEASSVQAQNPETAGNTAGNVAAPQPTAGQRAVDAAVTSLLMKGENITDEDRQAVVQVLVDRTQMTEQEARDAVTRWEATFAEVRTNAEEVAREAGQAVADSLAAIAGAIFAAMIVGAFAAGAGGYLGSPVPDETVAVVNT